MGAEVNLRRLSSLLLPVLRRLGTAVLVGLVLANCGGGNAIFQSPRQLIALAVEPSDAEIVSPGGTALSGDGHI